MHKRIWGLGLLGGFALCVACSGGTSDTGPGDAGASSPSSSSGASGAGEPMTCTEFAVGVAVGPELGGSATSRGIAQAVSDLGTAARGARDELGAQCKEIATALGAPSADRSAADAKTNPRESMTAWCALAATTLASQKAKAGGTLQVQLVPASCAVKVADKLLCQAACVSAPCDTLANPMQCSGGKLFVECAGDCTSDGSARGVACEGKCAGSCLGTCDGKLSSETSPGCSGTCKGNCTDACAGTAAAPVLCAGRCNGTTQPIECRGGWLRGGCNVDPNCDLACDVRSLVKAACPPPALAVSPSMPQDPAAAALLKSVIEETMPKVMAIQARAALEAEVASSFSAAVTSLADVKTGCIARIITAASDANEDISATANASAGVAGSFL